MELAMSPVGQHFDTPEDSAAKNSKKTPKRSAPTGPRQPRKRTKTGCLTCRKRRIKCGEERPTCTNCQKSRRDCEGYRPPIVFRRSHLHSGQPGVSLAPHSDLTNNPYFNNLATQFGALGQEGLPGWSSVSSEWSPTTGAERAGGFSPAVLQASQQGVPGLSSQLAFNAFPGAEYEQAPAQFFDADIWQLPVGSDASKPAFTSHSRSSQDHTPGITPISQDETLSLFHEAVSDPSLYGHEPYRPVNQNEFDFPQASSTDYPAASVEARSGQPIPSLFPIEFHDSSPAVHGSLDYGQTVTGPQTQVSPHAKTDSTASIPRLNETVSASQPGRSTQVSGFGHPGPSQILDAAAVAIQDDDYWDLPSEEDDAATRTESHFDATSLDREFDTITTLTKSSMALAISNLTDANAYTYPGFSLDSYRPERTANPLRNPYTQRVFAHFVFSTGPLISYLQQRNRVSLSHSSVPGVIGSSHQGLWTYTLATMALHNQALLHAMLAMASLHMAKLQGASSTPSLKHYSYSLRRVHRDVQHDRKRHEVPTLAATLLLAFYEIMQADHRKWSTHLVGAKQLISEIDFAGTTAQIQRQKAKFAATAETHASFDADKMHSPEQPDQGYTIGQLFPDSDSHLISKLMGKFAREERGPSTEDWIGVDGAKDLSASELRNFQILQDLFWWNARHDIIHGLVGGNALLLNYQRWKDCQPRAPAGQANAVHGSFDHFMLLMGRLVVFIAEDRPRKIRASQVVPPSAGQQDHAAGLSASSQPSNPPPPTGPGFYGMAPSAGPGPLPRAFRPPDARSSPTNSSNTSPTPTSAAVELETATAMAVKEWNEIISAFAAFADALGTAFQPLADDEHPPFNTPFGAAVLFKSHAIAALWAWYYAGLIIAMRSHPSMPAPATMAVGSAASRTDKYANQVGRIVYCITSDFLTPPLDPSSAGAFSEASLPLFFAGVQYQDAEQRRWTIHRLREIESLTGWATIGLCATGCESSWVKAHELGRGPEYVRSTGIEQGEGSMLVSEEVQEENGPLPTTGTSSTRGSFASAKLGKPETSATARAKSVEVERRFTPFYRGTQVMWAYQLFTTTLEDDLAGMPHGRMSIV